MVLSFSLCFIVFRLLTFRRNLRYVFLQLLTTSFGGVFRLSVIFAVIYFSYTPPTVFVYISGPPVCGGRSARCRNPVHGQFRKMLINLMALVASVSRPSSFT